MDTCLQVAAGDVAGIAPVDCTIRQFSSLFFQLEDCALQIYRYHSGSQGDYGSYLDLESSLDEQAEELEGFTDQ